ncbi:4-hydroxy-tetrahydrodipicolinate reductase [Thermospira aquatica]|uniref:4-hydroxy-tetrahydrodipicolinate reductase n=1 Tax=Thermospira aquatica TaxID=2828656 RepID=A0AAX3BAJ4_9SPIR|nr:4-hydroxy-tetrahydrodipicolinate reductase [Thermospira aquatica]URA09206.1 4-hydroxy-tetrahydrodipicolinate reductase [Thermospira aquatica]
MVTIAIMGAAGRMGRTLIQVISQDPQCRLGGALESSQCALLGQDAGVVAGVGTQGVSLSSDPDDLSACDVFIDFSSVEAFEHHVEIASRFKKAYVVGTTGLREEHFKALDEASKVIPVLWAPNFSVGVNLMVKLVQMAAEVLSSGFDVEIVEAHHRLKKDAPSGTAVKLLEVLKEAYKTEDVIYGRSGITGERPQGQIGVHAVRGGDIVGDHTVSFCGIGERIEITHRASSRETFARGAVRAAKFLAGKPAKRYTIEEVLGL